MTGLTAGLPPGVEPVFDLGERDFDNDYDPPAEDPTGDSIQRCPSPELMAEFQPIGDPAETQPPIDAADPIPPERTVKAYVVKYTPYKTFVSGS